MDNNILHETGWVFLSYTRKDERIVEKVHADLVTRGVKKVWRDTEQIRLTEKWLSVILKAIENSSAMIVFVSRDYHESEIARQEYETAIRLGINVIPLVIDPTYPSLYEALKDKKGHNTPLSDLQAHLLSIEIDKRTGLPHPQDDYHRQLNELLIHLPRHEYMQPELTWVEGGEFIIGAPWAKRQASLPDYWIGKQTVGVTEFVCFLKAGGLENPEYWPPRVDSATFQRTDFWPFKLAAHQSESVLDKLDKLNLALPMTGVTWHQAFAYCEWLNQITDHQYGYRLPTSMEWEKAARGTDGRQFPWGSTWQKGLANTKELAEDAPEFSEHFGSKDYRLLECGFLSAQNNGVGDSPYGCHDMVGNVWEWTLCEPGFPLQQVTDVRQIIHDPENPRVVRGGSWNYDKSEARVFEDRRSQSPFPEQYRYELGFRVVASRHP